MRSEPSIHLRPTLPSDIPTLFRYQADPEGNALAATIARDFDSFKAVWEGIFNDPVKKAHTIPRVIMMGDALVGSINCLRQDGADSIGYWVAREHWGKGIATRAIALMLDEVRARPLFARVASHNTASIRALERNGFVLTGRLHVPGDARFLTGERLLFVLA